MLVEYNFIFYFAILAIVIACIILIVSYSFVFQNNDSEKISAYECGFQPFGDTRERFDVRFYLVAILFIVFDLEIMFLFPWAISLFTIGLVGYFSMMAFLIILTLGFVYEWRRGALDWT